MKKSVFVIILLSVFIFVSSVNALGATNLALNKPVTFSSQQSGNEASHINDGDATTSRWAASPIPQWVQIDLGAVYNINQTELVPFSNRAYQYTVKVSSDGTNYTQVVNRTGNTTGGSLLTDKFSAVNARYVKLTVTGCYSYTGTWASFYDFRVLNTNVITPTASVTPTATPTSTNTATPSSTPTPVGILTTGTYNDTTAGIVYSGTWGYNTLTGGYNNDYHSSQTTNDYYQFTFNGLGARVYGQKNPYCGKIDIYIDNVFKKTVDLYSATYQTQQLYYDTGSLMSGNHTFKVVVKGTKNSAALGCWVECDKVEVYNSTSGWKLVWSDEFNGTSLDTSNWQFETNIHVNNELQQYTNRTENVRVENGNLVLEARKESYGGYQYTSGRVNTDGKHSWTYGKMEARIKLPYGKGVWPAFWMLGSNIATVGWPACGECDIMEMVGGSGANERTCFGTIHWDNGGHQSIGGNTALSSGKFADAYHIFSVEWDSSQIRWFLDGSQYYSTSVGSLSAFQKPFFIILNFAVGGDWPGSPDSTTIFPQQMLIDYVRVYQK